MPACAPASPAPAAHCASSASTACRRQRERDAAERLAGTRIGQRDGAVVLQRRCGRPAGRRPLWRASPRMRSQAASGQPPCQRQSRSSSTAAFLSASFAMRVADSRCNSPNTSGRCGGPPCSSSKPRGRTISSTCDEPAEDDHAIAGEHARRIPAGRCRSARRAAARARCRARRSGHRRDCARRASRRRCAARHRWSDARRARRRARRARRRAAAASTFTRGDGDALEFGEQSRPRRPCGTRRRGASARAA